MSENKKRILLLDDDQLIITTVERILKILNYEVESVSTGEELLNIYKQRQNEGTVFDIVIMDLIIPNGMGGKETIGKLRKIDPNVKTLVSSGNPADPAIVNYEEFGFNGVLEKPFTIDNLKSILESLF